MGDTVAIERGCCEFFALDHDASQRRLSITVQDPDRVEALDMLKAALTDPRSPVGGELVGGRLTATSDQILLRLAGADDRGDRVRMDAMGLAELRLQRSRPW